MKIAIQGNPGSFHHIVASRWYGTDNLFINAEGFPAVFEALRSGAADAAVVAVENSLYGSFTEVYDLLQHNEYPVVGEVSEHIHQNLIGYADMDIKAIRRIYSQYMALAQCEQFLQTHLPEAERIDYHDTAAAVAYIKASQDRSAAAIASSLAAEMHDMAILQVNVEDNPYNYTRFLIIEPGGTVPADADKASLILATSHKPGALFLALGVFASLGCNLTKVQSHPVPEQVWQYQFYVDVEIDAAGLQQAGEMLQKQGCSVRILGHYKADEAIGSNSNPAVA